MRPLFPLLVMAATARVALAVEPGSFELIDPAALGFGVSGYTVDGASQGELGYDSARGGLQTFQLRTIAPLGKVAHGDWIFAVTLNHAWTAADFGSLGGIGSVDLQSLKATILGVWMPPESRWFALGLVSPGVATDFKSPGDDAFAANALALLGYRWSDSLDLAVGAFANYGLGEISGMASVGFIWRPNDRWIVQATPPIVALGFKPTRQWLISAVAYPGGGEWEVGRENDRVRQVDLSLWRAALSVERKLTEHWRVGVRGGVAFGGELELRDSDARVLESQDLAVAPFGALSVRWAF